jgi:hypothetical protein
MWGRGNGGRDRPSSDGGGGDAARARASLPPAGAADPPLGPSAPPGLELRQLTPPDELRDAALAPYLDALTGKYLRPMAGDAGRALLGAGSWIWEPLGLRGNGGIRCATVHSRRAVVRPTRHRQR